MVITLLFSDKSQITLNFLWNYGEMLYKTHTFHSVFFFTNCKRTKVDGFYLIHLTPFSMQSPNARIGKLPFFSTLRFVKLMFSFWSFSNFCFQFVSSANFLNKTILCFSHLRRIDRISRRTWWWLVFVFSSFHHSDGLRHTGQAAPCWRDMFYVPAFGM